MAAPLQILCPVCQTGPLDPPKACEFCPDSVVEHLEEITAVIAQLAKLAAEAPRVPVAGPERAPAGV